MAHTVSKPDYSSANVADIVSNAAHAFAKPGYTFSEHDYVISKTDEVAAKLAHIISEPDCVSAKAIDIVSKASFTGTCAEKSAYRPLGPSIKKSVLRQIGYRVYFSYRMEFEYDLIKSQTNKKKHGIDFEEAQALWLDEDRVEFPARSDTEERHALIARKDEKVWVAFYTMRKETVRIISVRRARETEERAYYDI